MEFVISKILPAKKNLIGFGHQDPDKCDVTGSHAKFYLITIFSHAVLVMKSGIQALFEKKKTTSVPFYEIKIKASAAGGGGECIKKFNRLINEKAKFND